MQNNITPASQAQINFLKKLGYQGNTEGLTSIEASQLINQLNGGINQAPAQPQYQGYAPQQQTPQMPSQSQMQLILKDNELADNLFTSLNEMASDGQLYFPENYSIGNALKSAMSKILTSDQCAKLLACTPESKKQALTEYLVQGLDASKNQAYFIPFGDKMTMMRSYFGDVAVTKSTGLVKDVYAIVIYEGDEIITDFDEYGRETLVSHKTKFENRDNAIKGAYAVAVGINDYKAYCFMTMKEIQASWNMTKAKQNNQFQTNFKQEAAKRTVIRRLVKMIFNTSENTTEKQSALIGSYNRTTEDEYSNHYEVERTTRQEQAINHVEEQQAQQEAKVKPTINVAPQPQEQPAQVEETPQEEEIDFNIFNS